MKRIRLILLGVIICAQSKIMLERPPMGWMSWFVFRCNVDCESDPFNCVGEQLIKETAQAFVQGGFYDAGYQFISIDDCWMSNRRKNNNELHFNVSRFPSGVQNLSNYINQLGLSFGIYADEGTKTCQDYPGSLNYEDIDAQTFSEWNVKYLKLDGCNNNISNYQQGYTTFGNALRGKNIVYSCSWPAYLGNNELTKPYTAIAASGCNLWRNFQDIQCSWNSLASIIDHWGEYSEFLSNISITTKVWNDPDQLIIGNSNCITMDEARTQFAVWSIVAAPLIMGNDLRNISLQARNLLLNREAIAIDQDPLGIPGTRLSSIENGPEVWRRYLSSGRQAVAVLNRNDYAYLNFSLYLTRDLGWPRTTPAIVRNIFTYTNLGIFGGKHATPPIIYLRNIPPHGVSFLRISPAADSSSALLKTTVLTFVLSWKFSRCKCTIR
mmetsp:Transcript_2852/g.4447  ORF Transcript_2852/g.4447 Transcript_2852/m.4447 type:complete len:438 (-) Transcript_2852:264-1577(-)